MAWQLAKQSRTEQGAQDPTRRLLGYILPIVTIFAIFAAAQYLYELNQPPQYVAKGKVLILAGADSAPVAAPFISADATSGHRHPSERAAVLQAPHFIAHVLKALDAGLESNANHQASFDGELAEFSLLDRIVQALPLASDAGLTLAREQQNFLDRLSVSKEQQARLLDISYRSADPELAAQVVNQVIASYQKTLAQQELDRIRISLQTLLGEISRVQAVIEQKKLLQQSTNTDGPQSSARDIADLKASQNLLDTLLLRYREAQLVKSAEMVPPQIRIISNAMTPYRPAPYFSKSQLASYWGLALALAFALFLRRFMKARQLANVASLAGSPLDLPIASDCKRHPEERDEECEETLLDVQSGEAEQACHLSLLDHEDAGLAWEMAKSDCSRSILLAPVKDKHLVDERQDWVAGLALQLAQWGRSVIVVGLEPSQGIWPQITRKFGLSDLVDGQAGYADLIQADPNHHCHSMSAGTRSLLPSDFSSPKLHTLLQALERTYDHVLIDASSFFDNQYVLECLAIGSSAHMLVAASPDILEYDTEIERYFSEMGFANVTLAMQSNHAQYEQNEALSHAAE